MITSSRERLATPPQDRLSADEHLRHALLNEFWIYLSWLSMDARDGTKRASNLPWLAVARRIAVLKKHELFDELKLTVRLHGEGALEEFENSIASILEESPRVSPNR